MDNCFTGRRDRSRQTSEKDVLYIIPAGPARGVHSPGGASYFLFLSRHRDVIASFLFGTWRVKTCFHDKQIFVTTPYTSILFHLKEVLQCYLRLCLLQDRDEVPVVTLWLGLTPTPSVHVVEIRGWVTTLASRKNVMSVRGLLLNRFSNYQQRAKRQEGDCVLLCSYSRGPCTRFWVCWVKWRRSRLHSLSQPLLLPRRRNVVSLPSPLPARKNLPVADLQLMI